MEDPAAENVTDDINSLIAQCSSQELEAILRTLDSEGADSQVATVMQTAGDVAQVESDAAGASAPAETEPVPVTAAPAVSESTPANVVDVKEKAMQDLFSGLNSGALEKALPASKSVAAPAASTQLPPTTSEVTLEASDERPVTPSEDVKEVVGAVIRRSLQEGMEIQGKLLAQYGTGSSEAPATEAQENPQGSTNALSVPSGPGDMLSPAPPTESGRRAPPPSPAGANREIREMRLGSSPAEEVKPATAPAETTEAITEAQKQPVEKVSIVATSTPATQGPTLDTLLQVMKDQHQSVVSQIQWVASMTLPSTEYLTGVLNQRDSDIVQLQVKLDQLKAELQAKDDKIENQCAELNENVQSCRHWLVDLEFHKQKLEESMGLNQALEETNKNLAAEIEAASQQVKHASLDVEHSSGLSRTPIVTPRGITVGWAGGYTGFNTGYCGGGIPMQGSIPWVFRKQR